MAEQFTGRRIRFDVHNREAIVNFALSHEGDEFGQEAFVFLDEFFDTPWMVTAVADRINRRKDWPYTAKTICLKDAEKNFVIITIPQGESLNKFAADILVHLSQTLPTVTPEELEKANEIEDAPTLMHESLVGDLVDQRRFLARFGKMHKSVGSKFEEIGSFMDMAGSTPAGGFMGMSDEREGRFMDMEPERDDFLEVEIKKAEARDFTLWNAPIPLTVLEDTAEANIAVFHSGYRAIVSLTEPYNTLPTAIAASDRMRESPNPFSKIKVASVKGDDDEITHYLVIDHKVPLEPNTFAANIFLQLEKKLAGLTKVEIHSTVESRDAPTVVGQSVISDLDEQIRVADAAAEMKAQTERTDSVLLDRSSLGWINAELSNEIYIPEQTEVASEPKTPWGKIVGAAVAAAAVILVPLGLMSTSKPPAPTPGPTTGQNPTGGTAPSNSGGSSAPDPEAQRRAAELRAREARKKEQVTVYLDGNAIVHIPQKETRLINFVDHSPGDDKAFSGRPTSARDLVLGNRDGDVLIIPASDQQTIVEELDDGAKLYTVPYANGDRIRFKLARGADFECLVHIQPNNGTTIDWSRSGYSGKGSFDHARELYEEMSQRPQQNISDTMKEAIRDGSIKDHIENKRAHTGAPQDAPSQGRGR